MDGSREKKMDAQGGWIKRMMNQFKGRTKGRNTDQQTDMRDCNIPVSECMQIAAHGRPFHMGMVYDCRSDKLFPNVTLWDRSTLQKTMVQVCKSAESNIIASDTIDEKSTALDMNVGQKLSFLGNLVEVSGSGKYLENRVSSRHFERVTLQYKCTTKIEEMTMDQLGKGRIQHSEIFNNGTATHVVAGITYGAHAFFVFDREMPSNSMDHEVSSNLHVMIKGIPERKIDGKGEVDISENEKKSVNTINCTYMGDILPKENISTYEDAVRFYKDIPNYIGDEGENAVPINVRLYPLALLDIKACKLVKEIRSHMVKDTENFMEHLYEIDVRCSDMLKSDVVQNFRGIQSEIKKFKDIVSSYKLKFQKELSLLLPHIRGGGKKEEELVDLLKKKDKSPFNHASLNIWLETKEYQMKILSGYKSSLSQIKFASKPGDLQAIIVSPENLQVLCFSILMPASDSHLTNMSGYLHKEESFLHSGVFNGENTIQLTKMDNGEAMMEKARRFRLFFEANKDNRNTDFIVDEEYSESCKLHAKIKYYKDGSLEDDDFAIPLSPSRINVKEVWHDRMLLCWEKPTRGISNIKEYKIYCQDTNGNNDDVTHSTDSDASSFTVTGLQPSCEYNIQVESICEAGLILPCTINQPIRTKDCIIQPGKPEVLKLSSNSVDVRWSKPLTLPSSYTVTKYVVLQQQDGICWNEVACTDPDILSVTLNINHNITYSYKVYCECDPLGKSQDSEVSNSILIEINKVDLLKDKICKESELFQSEGLRIYKPKLNMERNDDKHKIQKFTVGSIMHNVKEKVILVIGATGSGKTTLINGLVNYVFGVKWSDDFRFKMIIEPGSHNQAMSQTKKITSYTLYHQEGFKVPYTLSIIDTPGFGDCHGIEADKEIAEQIRIFFSGGGSGMIDHIDAVGFVAQSSLPRLTPTQRYIFDQIISLFGKDMEGNIFMLLTFADAQQPQALSALKEAKLPYEKYFKFNNSALYSINQQTNEEGEDSHNAADDLSFDKMFWDMGGKSFKHFLDHVNNATSKSLTLTRDVLKERRELEVSIDGINKDIRAGLSKLAQLDKEGEILEKHKAEIDRNKNFTYTVEEVKAEKKSIPSGQHTTTCLICNYTCHENCAFPNDKEKKNCSAMKNEYCTICTKKCFWEHHVNTPYIIVMTTQSVVKTAENLRKKYQVANENKLSAEALIQKSNEEFQAAQKNVTEMVIKAKASIDRLQEIALKPNPLSTLDYIDILIESEKSEAKPGWEKRVQQLQNVRDQAKCMEGIVKGDLNPFKNYKDITEDEQSGSSWFRRILGW